MSNALKGIVSGLVATVVLSIAMLLKINLHLVPDNLSVMNLLGRLAGGTGSAWADHFIIGTLIWGLVFAGFESVTPAMPHWLKGIIFSLLAWLVMMLAFMPYVGTGLFGHKLGAMAAIVTLIQHLIYGVTLGTTWGLLTAWFPVQDETAPAAPRVEAQPPRRQKAAG